ncbi:flagellar basal body L-ring protein FlgH [Comamonas sp. GB3 AK4-5]|uniref:flagellar basal body L-ring protein FlgH n=1 Tax=Comamonas sp. GB3 AK4-5 TaxID=3231487 RepID=UPI00351F3665
MTAALVLTGCAPLNQPPPVDLGLPTQPLAAAAIAAPAAPSANTGGLFQNNRYRPPFESRKARMVGDIVTIAIIEKVTASQKQSSSVNRKNNMEMGVTALPFMKKGSSIFDKLGAELDNKNDFSGAGGTESANAFTGSITTTVIDVLPNGHLIVAGEKQIGVNHNVDVLRFTGTVDPYMLQPNSVIPSTQVANVRVESRSRGQQGSAQSIGWLSSFFLDFMPF